MFVRAQVMKLPLARAALAFGVVCSAWLTLGMASPDNGTPVPAEALPQHLFLPAVSASQAPLTQPDAAADASAQAATQAPVQETAPPLTVTETLTDSGSDNEMPLQTFLPAIVASHDASPQETLHDDEAAPDDEEDILTEPPFDAVSAAAAVGTTYYVDCAGNDARNGKSQANAWKSMDKANAAPLTPGDRMLFKRGCRWTGPLKASWRANSQQRIVIGAYGTGDMPIIADAPSANVKITGTWLTIQNLHATRTMALPTDPLCAQQPLGFKVGFEIQGGASNNTIWNNKASKLAIGVSLSKDSFRNRVIGNTIVDNNVLWDLVRPDIQGAIGILLHGDRQEIASNYFANNKSGCAYFGDYEHISIEVFDASNSIIHHNVSYDRVFTELGTSSTYITSNNTYAYNVHVASNLGSNQGARFVITRGYGHLHGPVLNTKVVHNTVYLTGNSKGISCWPCGTDILTLRDNILWVDPEPFAINTLFVEANNLFWSSDGTPLLNWRGGMLMSLTSRIARPLFVDAAKGNFNLQANSPARDRGSMSSVPSGLDYDVAQSKVPIGAQADIGAYEYRADPWLTVTNMPGRIEAEDFRNNGEGGGYHDTTTGNAGGVYRTTDVDIENTKDSSGARNLGWIAAGEWLAYDIRVPAFGQYRVDVRIASPAAGARFHIEVNGVNVSGSVAIPATGSMQTWVDVPTTIRLAGGRHTLRFVADTKGFNLNYFTFTKIW